MLKSDFFWFNRLSLQKPYGFLNFRLRPVGGPGVDVHGRAVVLSFIHQVHGGFHGKNMKHDYR